MRKSVAESAALVYVLAMILKNLNQNDTLDTLPMMPSWVTLGRNDTIEDIAFLSGGALSHLHLILNRQEVPHALLRARLALGAAEANVILSGRMERAADLRDEVHLLRPGDQAGPAGAIYQSWQAAVERPVSVKAMQRALPMCEPKQIATWMDVGRGMPVECASYVLEAVLADAPHAEEAAMILADATLARALGWDHVVPLLGSHLKSRDFKKTGEDLRFVVHRSIVAATKSAVQLAAHLARRAAVMNAVAPKLRSKSAAKAVALFMSRDALSPSIALTGFMTDRSARRLCDRLVDLGAVSELTGRDSFRLYGV